MLLAYSIAGVKTTYPFGEFGAGASFDEGQAKSASAKRDRKTLETSEDANLLFGAAFTLTEQVRPFFTRRLTGLLKDVEDLIVALYERAMAIDPEPKFLSWKGLLMSAYLDFANYTDVQTKKVTFWEKALPLTVDPVQRGEILEGLSQLYLDIGDTAKATQAAKEVLNSDQDVSNVWRYGNTMFRANMVLGRIALKHGDTKEAVRRLLAAGRTPKMTFRLSSFGPSDWRLAEDLLAAGERDSVRDYLDLLRASEKDDTGRLDAWISTIRGGGTPDFTGAPNPVKRYIGWPAPEFRLKDLKGANSPCLNRPICGWR